MLATQIELRNEIDRLENEQSTLQMEMDAEKVAIAGFRDEQLSQLRAFEQCAFPASYTFESPDPAAAGPSGIHTPVV